MAQPMMTNPITDQLNELRDTTAQLCSTVQSYNASPSSFVMKDQLGAQQGQGIVKSLAINLLPRSKQCLTSGKTTCQTNV